MDQINKPSDANQSIPQPENHTEGTRREALKKIAKFSAYTAPVLLASISGKVSAAS